MRHVVHTSRGSFTRATHARSYVYTCVHASRMNIYVHTIVYTCITRHVMYYSLHARVHVLRMHMSRASRITWSLRHVVRHASRDSYTTWYTHRNAYVILYAYTHTYIYIYIYMYVRVIFNFIMEFNY